MQISKPPAARQDDTVDIVHAVPVPDPYRWLEDGDSEDTRAWVAQQNAITHSVLESLPNRDAVHARLDRLFSIGSVGSPAVRGSRYFYQRRDGRQDQPVLVVHDGAERVILDPNRLG